MPLKTKHRGVEIEGTITHAAYDFFKVQIDSPYSDLRDGSYHDPEVPKKFWYVKDNQIKNLCRKEGKRLLVELYQAAFLFERERQALQKILLDAIEQGNEFYSRRDSHDSKIEQAFSIDLKGKARKITDPLEVEQLEDTRPYEEQRDFHILNRILLHTFFHHKPFMSRATLAQLIKRHFGITLVCPNRLEQFISERQQAKEGRQNNLEP